MQTRALPSLSIADDDTPIVSVSWLCWLCFCDPTGGAFHAKAREKVQGRVTLPNPSEAAT